MISSIYENVDQELLIEVQEIVKSKWNFLYKPWPINEQKYFHTSEIKDVKNIQFIKNELLTKLGYVSVFYFLTELYTSNGYIGPYPEIEKGLLLLYQLVSGLPNNKFDEFIPYSTYEKLYKQFWIKKYEEINTKVTNGINGMFSNERIRILSSLINNPQYFKHVTLLLDGHDSRIAYYNESKKDTFSYKLKKPGLRTQVVIDTNEMVVYVSASEKCGINNDSCMFTKMKIEKFMNKSDCIAIDGGYSLSISNLLEKTTSIIKELNFDNFCYPIRKQLNEELTQNEKEFNDIFASFRSKIEHQFASIGSMFQRFNNCKCIPYIRDSKHYNLQFKVACLLKNIKLFIEKFNIEYHPYHELWTNNDFDFPIKEEKLKQILNNEVDQLNKIIRMQKIQQNVLQKHINEDNISIDTENELSEIESEYEIEDILDHKVVRKVRKYLVKWKDYSEEYNSWESENDIFAKEAIENYWKKNSKKEN